MIETIFTFELFKLFIKLHEKCFAWRKSKIRKENLIDVIKNMKRASENNPYCFSNNSYYCIVTEKQKQEIENLNDELIEENNKIGGKGDKGYTTIRFLKNNGNYIFKIGRSNRKIMLRRF